MPKPRIIVASATFDERSGYLEVVFARALGRLGCEVLVVAAHVHEDTPPEKRPYRIWRVEKFILMRETVVAPQGLDRLVKDFKPDAAFLLAPIHGLSYALLRHLPAACKVIPVFADLTVSDTRRRGRWLLGPRGIPIVKWLIKDRWYRNLMSRADLIYPITNETERILAEIDPENVRKKSWKCGLAVDSSDFGFNPAMREPTSGWKELVTVTTLRPAKAVEDWIQPVFAWLRQNPGWRYTLAGLPPGSKGDAIRPLIEAPDLGDRYRIMGLLKAPEINHLYNNSDLAIWYLATIGIQQSMKTGLPVLLPSNGALEHLVEEGVNGLYYRDLTEVPRKLDQAAAIPWDRERIAQGNAKLCAEDVVSSILGRVDIHL
ncbi:MAG TPA: glycosyltransferase [Verrucomicrobiales bacterium]|nr:glycosyltransferase [Verrucomicrobiales bacterium]